ncbi:hypothetical protein [Dokdonella sp.]|uniref:hypothetical protein n=1 Tax=Dokdonella sp. TaxID=2291710 RepID=UPI0025BBD90C|nr:hypothetical protein [Dokdonella sp.]MBX3689381.1 hypothetical protein [Dokdonella sp.]
MFHRYLILATIGLSFIPSAAAIAADTDIDQGFAGTGHWQRLFESGSGSQHEYGVAHARTADGGYVVAAKLPGGAANGGTGKRIGLFRLDHNGNFVISFGTNGKVIKDAWLTSVTDMTVDAQGRIIVIGTTPGQGGLGDFGVVRFNADGSDDTSFAGDGGTAVGFDVPTVAFDDFPASVLAETDGRIVIAGSTTPQNSTSRWAVLRLNENGSIDSSFGTISDGQGGHLGSTDTFIAGEPATGRRILKIASGHYVITGTSMVSDSDHDFAARILTPMGEQWSGFAGSRRFAIDSSGPNGLLDDLADAVLVNPTTILLVGASGGRFAATRIIATANSMNQYSDLDWDSTFIGSNLPGNPNVYVGDITDSIAGSAAVDASGRSWLVGFSTAQMRDGISALSGAGNAIDGSAAPYANGLVTRLHPDGSPDLDFGGGNGFWFFSAPYTVSTLSYETVFTRVLFDGPQPVLLGSATYSIDSDYDFDGVITRLQSSDVIFANGYE